MSRRMFATLGSVALAAGLSPLAAGADVLQGLRPGHPRLLSSTPTWPRSGKPLPPTRWSAPGTSD